MPALVVWAAITLVGCGSDTTPGHTGADTSGFDADAQTSDVDLDDLPPITTSCTHCHDIQALARGEATMGTREWMVQRGDGLVRVDPALPISPSEKRIFFVRRGRHAAVASGCGACHPVRDDGIGHGVKTFPDVTTVFRGGDRCGGSCHSWLYAEVESLGFLGASGKRATWRGSPRPEVLLEKVETAHTRLWRQGARPDPEAFRISAFNAGCGGCHHLREESHGAMLGCLDCHRFRGNPHERHIQVIASTMGTVDVEAVQEGVSPCSYCHVEDDPGMERSGAVCYNCHLSGHQPLDASQRAHFWPVP